MRWADYIYEMMVEAPLHSVNNSWDLLSQGVVEANSVISFREKLDKQRNVTGIDCFADSVG